MKWNENKKDIELGYISKFERDTVATFYTLWDSQYFISRYDRNWLYVTLSRILKL